MVISPWARGSSLRLLVRCSRHAAEEWKWGMSLNFAASPYECGIKVQSSLRWRGDLKVGYPAGALTQGDAPLAACPWAALWNPFRSKIRRKKCYVGRAVDHFFRFVAAWVAFAVDFLADSKA